MHPEPPPLTGLTARHNHYRAEFGLPPLVWSPRLATHALEWAHELVRRGCLLEHRPDQRYGENLFWSLGKHRTAQEVVDSWASGRAHYDFERHQCAPGQSCGHYTQIIWEDTREVGGGVAYAEGFQEIWVCNYDPPGNWVGQPAFRRR